MKPLSLLLFCHVLLSAAEPAREMPFDDGWRFHRGDVAGAEGVGFDDAAWRHLDLPHDWMIEDLPALVKPPALIDLSKGPWRFRSGDDMTWKDEGFDDSRWPVVTVPARWEDHGQSGADRVYGWYRRTITVPGESKGQDVGLLLGVIDDVDECYVNGTWVGSTGSFPPVFGTAADQQRAYFVPAALLRGDGSDVVAVRVFDQTGPGGITGPSGPIDHVRSGPFDNRLSGGRDLTGWTVGGVGWYRKTFTIPAAWRERRLELVFDGVYMDSTVWLNGRRITEHPGGFTAFTCDLTPHLRREGDNTLSVRVRCDGRNSRWYSGAGIIRPVRLVATGPVHVPTWGLQVTTPSVTAQRAMVSVSVELANHGPEPVVAQVAVRLSTHDGTVVAQGTAACAVPTDRIPSVAIACTVPDPRLWSCEDPTLYTAEATVLVGDVPVDRITSSFGIRRIEIDAEKGFRLNGVPMKLKGGCMHHDNGSLGAAAIARAEERRVELMKSAGYNAIRTSHNPPSTAFLDACDRLGMVVIDEAFDQWQRPKNHHDHHRFFDGWAEHDIAAMVRRDRNHPCVAFWSIGNEIQERFDRPDLALRLRRVVLAHDTSRPVTAAICSMWDNPGKDWNRHSDPASLHLDVTGLNYVPERYESDHARHPQRVMMCTESFPKDAWSYWEAVERHPWLIGDFVWTGFDYLGESGIGRTWIKGQEPGQFLAPWPWHIAGCGDIDILGRRKPWSWYREALWRPGVLHATVHQPLADGQVEQVAMWGWSDVRSHWTWPGHEGRPLTVDVYSSCDEVSLVLNGRQIGTKPTGHAQQRRTSFTMPYEPGELQVMGTIAGRTISHHLRTAGAPAALRLTADRSTITARRDDLAFIDIAVVDAAGIVVPSADHLVRLTVDGEGGLEAVGNADPVDISGFRTASKRAWRGMLQAILRPSGRSGSIRLQATADGLPPASMSIGVR